VQIRPKKPIVNKSGEIIDEAPRLFAQFQRGAPPDWALEETVSRLNFRGLAEGESPTLRMGTFDTITAQGMHGWSDDEREIVERELDKRQSEILMRLELPTLPQPWPTYDELKTHGKRTSDHVAEKNIQLARDIGVDLDDVIAYEKQNRNDERIIELYEAALAEARTAEPAEELVEA